MPRRKITEESENESKPARARRSKAAAARPAHEAVPKAPRRSVAKSAAPRDVQLEEPKASSAATPEAIRERAYYLAEKNGFAGDPAFYWMLAERELSVEA